ncbi:MAG TPA: metallophosphoesterase family protein [Aggregatilineales bacterium]|nr:metallophosphoesterase family protein [Aggregatilineales bacterium]
MKFLAVSDHTLPQLENSENLRKQFGDVEAVISCGDLPAPYLEYLSSTLNTPLLFVRGNHDLMYEEAWPGGDNLHRHVLNFRGITFAGLEGSPLYNRGPIQYTEGQMLRMVLAFAPRLLLRRMRLGYGLDVLVTHASPRDIHDRTDMAHRGFRSFRLFMNLYRPRYLLHGHVDKWDNRREFVTEFGTTTVININPMKLFTIEGKPRSGLG